MSRIYLSHPALWNQELKEVKGFHSTNTASVYENDGTYYLFSYNTLIARIDRSGVAFTQYHNYSSTTVKHLSKFLNRYLGGMMYINERNKHIKENGYLGVDIPL